MLKDVDHRYSEDPSDLNKKQPSKASITQTITERQLVRTREDVGKWRKALKRAESVLRPDRTDLQRTYKDVDLDMHITGIIGAIKNKVKAKDFMIVDQNGDEDEDSKKLFDKQWYFDFVDMIIEAPFFGYTLVQLGDIVDDGFPNMEMVPREYVIPDWNIVKKDLRFISRENGIPYLEAPWNKWHIFIGHRKNLGLFNKATPHALAKKNLFASAWEFGEIFGMPIRKGHTDIDDPKRKKNMERMMESMGQAAWGVFDKDDDIQLIESKRTDAYKVFVEPIKLSNNEISKGFTGGAGSLDEKAFVGSAEVQERLFGELVSAFMRMAKFVINDQLFPLMVHHRILKEGLSHKWTQEDTVSTLEKAGIIKDLAPFFTFSPDVVEEAIGIEVENNVVSQEQKETTVTNRVKELYKSAGIDL